MLSRTTISHVFEFLLAAAIFSCVLASITCFLDRNQINSVIAYQENPSPANEQELEKQQWNVWKHRAKFGGLVFAGITIPGLPIWLLFWKSASQE